MQKIIAAVKCTHQRLRCDPQIRLGMPVHWIKLGYANMASKLVTMAIQYDSNRLYFWVIVKQRFGHHLQPYFY